MSAKHKRHRPGKGSAVSAPDVKLTVCRECGRAGNVDKSTGKCTGSAWIRGSLVSFSQRCAERVGRREART